MNNDIVAVNRTQALEEPRTEENQFDSTQLLIYGAGGLGVLLLVSGAWMFIRSNRPKDRTTGDDFQDAKEEILDSIIALEDLHAKGEISDRVFQKKRKQLKDALKLLAEE